MEGADDLYFDAVSQVRLPAWSKGRVALLGDAASCVSLFGDGSSMVMIGAATLAAALGETPRDPLTALRQYEYGHRKLAASRQRVGDAACAVSLLAGQGGSLAIAGAALLGDILGPVDSSDHIGSALARFDREWRPVMEVAQASGRRAVASFLPRNRAQRLLRRWIIRGTRLPGIDRWWRGKFSAASRK